MKHLDVAVAVVLHDSKVLIARRKRGRVLGGFWEFPGGKQEPGESLHDCVRRELLEELTIGVHPQMAFTPVHHQYPDRYVILHAFLCTHEFGVPRLLASEEIRWVAPIELRNFAFPPANLALIEQIITALPLGAPAEKGISPRRKSRVPHPSAV